MSDRPILLFGAGGQLGQAITARADATQLPLTALSRAECDITDADAVAAAFATHRPALIVNVAAYTAVDRAESERDAAFATNATAPGTIARAAARHGAALIHLSTDYVFDGAQPTPYRENDPVGPLGVYGASKEAGERAVRAVLDRHLIVRTAWVYGARGHNFLKTMITLARTRDELRIVADQTGTPTATSDLADAILAATRRLIADDGPWGTFHVAGASETTWHGFAEAIIEAAAPLLGRRPTVTPIDTADYPTPARRPANSRLDSRAFAAGFGFQCPGFQSRIPDIVAAVLASDRAVNDPPG